MSNIRYIPRGVKVIETGEWQYSAEIGVRMTPGDCAAEMELTQIMFEGDGDEEVQHIELSLGQMQTLRDVLTNKIAELELTNKINELDS